VNRERTLLLGLFGALLLFVAVNLLAAGTLRGARLDLTAEKRFTLSTATDRLLGDLDEDIVFQLFVSKDALRSEPQLAEHAARVEELLAEYASRSAGKVRLEVLDPEPYSEVEDEAVARGLQGFADARGEPNVYLGVVAKNSVDGVETMPFLHPNDAPYLEYELSRTIQKLSAGSDKPTVGLITSLPMEGEPSTNPMARPRPGTEPWVIYATLAETYTLEKLDGGALTAIPAHIETLVVAHPKGLGEDALYAIDQFVLKGGRLFLFVDPWCEVDEGEVTPDDPFGGMMAERSSDLAPLLTAWGLTLRPNAVAGDPSLAINASFRGPSGREEVGPYLPWLGITGDAFDADELATRQLGVVRLASAGVFDRVEGASTNIQPLMQTSPAGATIPASDLRFGADPAKILGQFPKEGQRLLLAARISGSATSAYPNGPGAAAEDVETPTTPPEGHLAASTGSIQVFAVADADLLSDRFWVQRRDFFGTSLVQPTADNGAFVLNGVDLLTGGGDLVELRGRGNTERPFEVVRALQRESDARFRAEEQRLLEEERQFGAQINELVQKSGQSGGYVVLPPELEAELAALRTQREAARKRLREVRLNLNREVEALGARLRLIHVAILPGAVALLAVAGALLRGRRKPVVAPAAASRNTPSLPISKGATA